MEVQDLLQQKNKNQEADRIHITYYTDPLCCWSWAFDSEWKKLQTEFSDEIHWRYCMSGLLPGWKNYHDNINSVSRPAQMGPVWMHAGKITGVEIHSDIWIKDPPASSYPACIAVKCAELQSGHAGEKYFRLLQKACMLEGKNISKPQVLLEVATLLREEKKLKFNFERFKKNITGNKGIEAFRKDLQEVQYHNINRFPTLVIRKPHKPAVIVTGYRPFSSLAKILNDL